ncbi:hypothetical protein DSO57_1030260 [Entomophthora muscae]|uniref:Uncharacterized protein n=1 Tax=Entomophthora muscae TaxID=34485 RepID=A0ACC2ULK3_9FUNG|nr:hypothetical protein DSO57_1030260 [Entomophthora muscae]
MQKEKLIVLITGIGAVSLMLIGMGISLWKTKGQPTQASSQAETAAIVGGSKTDLAYNWIASLSYNGIHRCGAMLVGTNTVITAAHCKDGDLDKWALQVPKSKTILTSASTFKIKQWKNHPKYHHENYSYDVAILKIHGNFPLPTRSSSQPSSPPRMPPLQDGAPSKNKRLASQATIPLQSCTPPPCPSSTSPDVRPSRRRRSPIPCFVPATGMQ